MEDKKSESAPEYFRSAKILFRLLTGAPAVKDIPGLANDAELESGYGRECIPECENNMNPGRGPNPEDELANVAPPKCMSTTLLAFEKPGNHWRRRPIHGQAKKDFRTPDKHRGMDQGRGG